MDDPSSGMKIECAEDCGNAPKKALLRDLLIDYWKDGGRMLADHIAETVVWRLIGGPRHVGKDAVSAQMADSRTGIPTELHIHNIITHGNTAAANATVLMQDNSRIEFCNVYRFAGFGKTAKIKEITTYSMTLDAQASHDERADDDS